MTYSIDGMEDCIMGAIKFCDDFGGTPMVDIKKFVRESKGWLRRMKESIRRAALLNKLDKAHRDKFVGGIQEMLGKMKDKADDEK